MTLPAGPLTGAPIGFPAGDVSHKWFWEGISQSMGPFQDAYGIHDVGPDDAYGFAFRIPSDFVELLSMDLILSDTVDFPGGNINLSSAYGRRGDSVTLTTQNILLEDFTQTALLWNNIDLRSIYTALRADDYCGLRWRHLDFSSGDGFPYLGLYCTYL